MSQEQDMPMPMPMSPGSMSNNGTRNMKDMVMHMSFYWGKDATILFQGWPNHCLPMYILSLFFVFLLSLATEVLSVSPAAAKPGTSPVAGGVTQAGVYAVRIALAYMVMLSVMSFNLGIFAAAVAGHTVGFFLVKCQAAAAQEEAATGFTPEV